MTLVSTPLRIWRALRNIGKFLIFILRVTPLYSTLEVLQNTDVYMYIGIYTTNGTI